MKPKSALWFGLVQRCFNLTHTHKKINLCLVFSVFNEHRPLKPGYYIDLICQSLSGKNITVTRLTVCHIVSDDVML